MSEIWKDIKNYEGTYQVSSYGRIKSLDRYTPFRETVRCVKGRVLVFSEANGYSTVKLSLNSNAHTFNVHTLVYDTFIGKCRKGKDVDHIDHNRKNNHIENLQLLSRRENISKGVLNRNTSSKYIGVRFKDGKWETQIRLGKKRKYLGRFEKEIDAAMAYQNELKKYQEQSLP